MRKLFSPLLIIGLFTSWSTLTLAQPRGGFDPNEMIAREKQNLYTELPDLSSDQKMLIDGIYQEFSDSFTELREEAMKTRDFESMRPKMEALRKEKDELIKDVLSEEDYQVYLQMNEKNRARRRQQIENNPQVKTDSSRNN